MTTATQAILLTMDYCVAVEYDPAAGGTKRMHAVQLTDSQMHDAAVCGFGYGRTELQSDWDWEKQQQAIRCRACAVKLGVAGGFEV